MMASFGASVAAFLVLTTLGGFGNTVGYHRLLTHRAFVTPTPIRWTLTLLGAAWGGPPMVWVGIHRLHHAKSDGPEDPHSPIHGFWWAHCGWLIGTKNPVLCAIFALSGFGQQAVVFVHDLQRLLGRKPPEWRSICPDLMQEPFMRALDLPFATTALFLAQLGAAWAIGGPLGIGVLWAVHLALTNGSWGVNSVCHADWAGEHPFDTKELSRDVWWMAVVTFGEGWHNAHHRYPRSARHGLRGGFDASWELIRALERVGLVTEVWLPKAWRAGAPPVRD